MMELRENEVITLTAEDGSTAKLEYMTSTDYQGATYGAFYPVPEEDADILDADYDMVILRISEEEGAQIFDLVDDDDTFEALADIFMEKIFGKE